MSDHFTNLGAYYACPSQAVLDSKSGLSGSLKQLIDPFTEYEYTGSYDDYMADWWVREQLLACTSSRYTHATLLCLLHTLALHRSGDVDGGYGDCYSSWETEVGGTGCSFLWQTSDPTYATETREDTGFGAITSAYFTYDGSSDYMMADTYLMYAASTSMTAFTVLIWVRSDYYDPNDSSIFSAWSIFDFDRSELFNHFYHPTGYAYFSSAHSGSIKDTIETNSAGSLTEMVDDYGKVYWHLTGSSFDCEVRRTLQISLPADRRLRVHFCYTGGRAFVSRAPLTLPLPVPPLRSRAMRLMVTRKSGATGSSLRSQRVMTKSESITRFGGLLSATVPNWTSLTARKPVPASGIKNTSTATSP